MMCIISFITALESFICNNGRASFDERELRKILKLWKHFSWILSDFVVTVSGHPRKRLDIVYHPFEIDLTCGQLVLNCEIRRRDDVQQDGFSSCEQSALDERVREILTEVMNSVDKCNSLRLNGVTNIRFGNDPTQKNKSVIFVQNKLSLKFLEVLIKNPLKCDSTSSVEFSINHHEYAISLFFTNFREKIKQEKTEFEITIDAIYPKKNKLSVIRVDVDGGKPVNAKFEESVSVIIYEGGKSRKIVRATGLKDGSSCYGLNPQMEYTILHATIIDPELDL